MSELTPVSMHTDPGRAGIGYFPALHEAGLRHGFDWQGAENVRYALEPDYPSPEALDRVVKRLESFMQGLGLTALGDSVAITAIAGDLTISDITERSLSEIPHRDKRGRYIEAGAAFTSLPGVPLYALAGDCSWSVVHARRNGRPDVTGLIHIGRAEVEGRLASKAIGHLMAVYECAVGGITIGTTPTLEQTRHRINAPDVEAVIRDPAVWQRYSRKDGARNLYLDLHHAVRDQFIESGVPAQNITSSAEGTYGSSANGNGFSHRRHTETGAPNGRFAVATQLNA